MDSTGTTDLFRVSSRLFLFLSSFRQKIRRGIRLEPDAVAADLEEIFDEQARAVRGDPRLDALYEKAIGAHEAGDGPTWRRVYNEVQALVETAYQEEFAQMRLDDPAYIQRRTVGLTWRAQRVEAALAELEPSATDEVRAMQLAEKARVGKWLSESVQKPLKSLGGEPPKETSEDVVVVSPHGDTEELA